MNDEFAKDSWAWRVDLALRRLGEWWQWLWQSNAPRLPNEAPSGWAEFWRLLGDVFWVLLIASLSLWGLWALWRLVRPYWLLWQDQRPATTTAQPPSHQSRSQWRAQARQYQRQGNYTQACLCLYFGMLQHLHDHGQLPHQASRTDGEYHRALAKQPQPTPYYTLLTMHQRLKFANAPATQELLDRCLAADAQLS